MNQLCAFAVGDLTFGIEVQDVQEVIRNPRVTPVPRAAHAVGGLLNHRGRVVTAIDLRRQLGLPDRGTDLVPMHIVVRTAVDGLVCLTVDEVVDVVEVDPDMREPRPDIVGGPAWHLIDSMYRLPERLLLVLKTERAVSVNWAERESA